MKPCNLHTISGLKEIEVCKNVKLRPLDQSDAIHLLEILAADNTIRNRVSVASRLYTPDDIATEIEKCNKDPNIIRYALLKKKRFIGLISFWRDDGYFGTPPQPDDYGFGYFLDPQERGKGFLTRALQKLMEAIMTGLYVHQFVAFCEDNNPNSISVLTKLEFKPTGKTFSDPGKGWIERKYQKQPKIHTTAVTTETNLTSTL